MAHIACAARRPSIVYTDICICGVDVAGRELCCDIGLVPLIVTWLAVSPTSEFIPASRSFLFKQRIVRATTPGGNIPLNRVYTTGKILGYSELAWAGRASVFRALNSLRGRQNALDYVIWPCSACMIPMRIYHNKS